MVNAIENKHKELIDIAKKYMKQIDDYEHCMAHVEDVVNYTYELINKINFDIDKEVCIIAAYWHDVGRVKCIEGHEQLSAEMLKSEMIKFDYDNLIIDNCFNAIRTHKWDMNPTTIEGLLLKDADKLAWLGPKRWKICLEKKYSLDSIINMLPKLKSEILYFEESRNIYDREIIKLVGILYNYRNNN